MNRPVRGVVLSDFNADNFAAALAGDPADPSATAEIVRVAGPPYRVPGDAPLDFAVAWLLPESVSPAYRSLTEGRPADPAELAAEVDTHAEALLELASRARPLIVPVFVRPPYRRGAGMQEFKPGVGLAWALAAMNLRLAERLSGHPDVVLLDAGRWAANCGAEVFNPKRWYLAKVPFGGDLFAAAARDVKAALRGVSGRARKVVAVDLDGTLWGGIVGDDGWENLRVGGHDHAGEAYADLQRALRALARRGVLLAILSKNEEAAALEAFDRHPEMVLRREDFAAWRIDWRDKDANLAELAAELNVGLDAFVFIDDQPAERARVRAAFPEVLVPEWPKDPMLAPAALEALDCFDQPETTAEDRARGRLFAARREAGEGGNAGGIPGAEWIRSQAVRVRIAPLGRADLPRAAQLLNKTNQMNLATRRLAAGDFAAWLAATDREGWIARVEDRFGEYGLTGLVTLERLGGEVIVVDFLLSCRVFGRRVEDALLAHAARRAAALGGRTLALTFAPTARNRPCLDFLRRAGLAGGEGGRFERPAEAGAPYPEGVTVEMVDA